MTKKIGILTSGGDCPGLNATIRGVVKASYGLMNCTFYGILNGFRGLIEGDIKKMELDDFSGILSKGGTILGSHRTPFKKMRKIEADGIDKVKAMVTNYQKFELDCLVCLGGNGTHKNANILREEGLNIITLPKTIDNDIWNTDVTFGYQSAVDTAMDVIDRIHTTADSHDRVMIIELMGNKTGWLAINAGIAGGADVILIPEIPYNNLAIVQAIMKRHQKGKNYSIVVVAEGAKNVIEANMKKKEFKAYRKQTNNTSISNRIANMIKEQTGFETRVVIPGHILRGGSPTAYDRTLATQIGVYGAKLISQEKYGVAVAIKNNACVASPLERVAGLLKTVPLNHKLIETAKLVGINFGDECFNYEKRERDLEFF
ncbi:MAG: 6-phosphofructokinase [Marinisporobacter sp.]|jgi:6-phosphofructokinase 1|nr:6-phosphofructokinase [Marinisporobacter sp.]